MCSVQGRQADNYANGRERGLPSRGPPWTLNTALCPLPGISGQGHPDKLLQIGGPYKMISAIFEDPEAGGGRIYSGDWEQYGTRRPGEGILSPSGAEKGVIK